MHVIAPIGLKNVNVIFICIHFIHVCVYIFKRSHKLLLWVNESNITEAIKKNIEKVEISPKNDEPFQVKLIHDLLWVVVRLVEKSIEVKVGRRWKVVGPTSRHPCTNRTGGLWGKKNEPSSNGCFVWWAFYLTHNRHTFLGTRMKASGYTTDTSPFHIQSEGVKGFRFLFCRQPWKVNFAFLQFQLLRQTSFIWYFDVPYFFSWLNYYVDVYIHRFSKSMVNFSCYKSRGIRLNCPWSFTHPAGQVSRFGSGCVLLLRVIMWLLLRHDSACKTYGSCFFVGMIYVDMSW